MEDLKLLAQIQALDSQIDEREEKKREFPRRLIPLKEGAERIDQELREAKGELEDLQKKRRHEERELEAREIELKKYQRQLYEVKDNKAYAALEEEIALTKEKNEAAEEEILKFLEIEEGRIKEIKEIEEGVKEEKRKLSREEEKAKQETEVLDQEIAKINITRQEIAKRVSPSPLSRYEKLRRGKGGLAIVPLEGSSCGGCHMNLPPQIVSEVKKGKRFVVCENCNRILYWEEG
ncbi:C4-type zinc ribbon domain-containing protein [bacterium]|nr:C4-type zinc ribbon domain-containing protein [bacterium]